MRFNKLLGFSHGAEGDTLVHLFHFPRFTPGAVGCSSGHTSSEMPQTISYNRAKFPLRHLPGKGVASGIEHRVGQNVRIFTHLFPGLNWT